MSQPGSSAGGGQPAELFYLDERHGLYADIFSLKEKKEKIAIRRQNIYMHLWGGRKAGTSELVQLKWEPTQT